MSISCLVISRSAGLLNKLLTSLETARRYWGPEDEVLLAWNGSEAGEQEINPTPVGPSFRIATREAYHFASNMNHLASLANGEVLILLNDDLILDPGSLDHALQILASQSGVGLVGGRLRQPDGRLGHAGILFSEGLLPYNRFRPERLGWLLAPDRLEILASGEMPAVTGALMVIRRDDFLAVKFREDFRVCGEDVALCLDLRQQLGLATYYAADVTAVHAEKSTRGAVLDLFDQQKLAGLVRDLCREDPSLRGSLAHWTSQEADVLESLLHQVLQSQNRFSLEAKQARTELKQLEEDWQEQQSQAQDWRVQLDELDERLERLTLSNPNQLQAAGPDLAELAAEIERLRLEGDSLRHDRNHFSKELSRLTDERDNLVAEKESLGTERENLAKERDALNRALDLALAELELGRIREADLRSSTCWKITAPYRVVGDWLARIRSKP